MITINFASRNYRLEERVRAALTVVNILLVIGMLVIAWRAFSLRTDQALLDRHIREIAAAEEQTRPLLAERDRIAKDVSAMSGLIESRRFSWTGLLTNIEKVFPVGVALNRVEYNRRDRALTLDGAALSPESLRNLVVGLEGAAVFRDPYLKHQSLEKGTISFNVVASYQELKAAGLAQGK